MIILNKSLIEILKFPNNETKIQDFKELVRQNNLVELRYENDSDLIQLMFVKERLDEFGADANLFIHYMPYSRMDRKIEGDLFTLKYVCDFINNLNFKSTVVVEPHSEQTVNLLVNCKAIYPTIEWAKQIMKINNFGAGDGVVFPDEGAYRRYKNVDFENQLIFHKTRNPQTGVIEKIELAEGSLDNANKSKYLIIDDLCSRGGTFMPIATALKKHGAERVFLLTAHMENTIFEGQALAKASPIDHFYTSNSIITKEHEKISQIKIDAMKLLKNSGVSDNFNKEGFTK